MSNCFCKYVNAMWAGRIQFCHLIGIDRAMYKDIVSFSMITCTDSKIIDSKKLVKPVFNTYIYKEYK